MKEEAKQALDNASDYAEIFVKAMDEPIDGAIDELNKAGTKVASAAASGAVKVATDALGAVPGVGAIIDIGKMANDTGKALSEISENVDQGLDTLDEQKKAAARIANRTNESINQFQNPLNSVQNSLNSAQNSLNNKVQGSLNNLKPKGVLSGGKTRRKQFKRNVKSKRVRFAI